MTLRWSLHLEPSCLGRRRQHHSLKLPVQFRGETCCFLRRLVLCKVTGALSLSSLCTFQARCDPHVPSGQGLWRGAWQLSPGMDDTLSGLGPHDQPPTESGGPRALPALSPLPLEQVAQGQSSQPTRPPCSGREAPVETRPLLRVLLASCTSPLTAWGPTFVS